MKKSALLLSAIVLVGVIAFFGYQRMTQIPDLTPTELNLEDLSGVPINLGLRKERPILIYFWSTTSGKSQKTIAALKSAYAKYGHQVNFILVSDEDSNTITTFKTLQLLPFFISRSTKPLSDYGIHTLPATYFYDTKGKLISKKTGVLNEAELETELKKMLTP